MRRLAIVVAVWSSACESKPSKGALWAYRAGIVDAVGPQKPITPGLQADVNVDVDKNLVEILVPEPGGCGNVYTRIGLAKLKTPPRVVVTCGVAGKPSEWRLRERDGELWEAKD